jgi:uncharacterized protein involved in exopolysaccharide biosynthesis
MEPSPVVTAARRRSSQTPKTPAQRQREYRERHPEVSQRDLERKHERYHTDETFRAAMLSRSSQFYRRLRERVAALEAENSALKALLLEKDETCTS